MAKHGFDGPYARDEHADGLTDEYARDGGWSGGGRAEDVVNEDESVPADSTTGSPTSTSKSQTAT